MFLDYANLKLLLVIHPMKKTSCYYEFGEITRVLNPRHNKTFTRVGDVLMQPLDRCQMYLRSRYSFPLPGNGRGNPEVSNVRSCIDLQYLVHPIETHLDGDLRLDDRVPPNLSRAYFNPSSALAPVSRHPSIVVKSRFQLSHNESICS